MRGNARRPWPAGWTFLERGWLSSNSLLCRDEGTAVLFDTGHVRHAEQLVGLVQSRLGAAGSLQRLVNTHLHSDHCGGNAAMAAAPFSSGVEVCVPDASLDAVRCWDRERLGHATTGQSCPPFVAHRALSSGGFWHVVVMNGGALPRVGTIRMP